MLLVPFVFLLFLDFRAHWGVSLARGRVARRGHLRSGLSLSYSLFWWGCMLLVDLAPFHRGLVVCWCVGLVLSWSPVGVLALVRLLLVLSVWGSFSVHWWISVVGSGLPVGEVLFGRGVMVVGRVHIWAPFLLCVGLLVAVVLAVVLWVFE